MARPKSWEQTWWHGRKCTSGLWGQNYFPLGAQSFLRLVHSSGQLLHDDLSLQLKMTKSKVIRSNSILEWDLRLGRQCFLSWWYVFVCTNYQTPGQILWPESNKTNLRPNLKRSHSGTKLTLDVPNLLSSKIITHGKWVYILFHAFSSPRASLDKDSQPCSSTNLWPTGIFNHHGTQKRKQK